MRKTSLLISDQSKKILKKFVHLGIFYEKDSFFRFLSDFDFFQLISRRLEFFENSVSSNFLSFFCKRTILFNKFHT